MSIKSAERTEEIKMNKDQGQGGFLPPELASIDNQALQSLPHHLFQFIVAQQYRRYTPIDHAVWRYVMRQNFKFLKDNAHPAYVEGLKKTGISLEKIPSIVEMNQILDKIGWAAVTVDGFIPPAAFMEYQAYRVLVIAADMRQIDHIEYTPAPDIIHEAAGHAPIIADPEYAEYLRRIGEYGAKALSSKKDYQLYEAIRHLSILKEAPQADPKEVEAAEKDVDFKQKNLGTPSEMALISRLHWWTVEFGLYGDLKRPKIYGAGLLSSIGESYSCLTDKVEKLPYNLETQNYAFDITTRQPHLFVTPSFQNLIDVLEEFAQSMAFRLGGTQSVHKAIECQNVTTCELSSGLQISGIFTEVLTNGKSEPAYLKTRGPSALAYRNSEIAGHGKSYHAEGFGTPVGRLRDSGRPLEEMTDAELKESRIQAGNPAELNFASGVTVKGNLEKILRKNGKIVLLTFSNCRVIKENKLLFNPDWGTYDMAVGEKVTSVFSGAADKDAYEQVPLVPKERTIKVQYDEKTVELQKLYRKIQDYREQGTNDSVLLEIWREVKSQHPKDWLLSMEILEILAKKKIFPELEKEIRSFLEQKAKAQPELSKLINDGLRLIY
jgi:phenylalanine-4-hydroxylase